MTRFRNHITMAVVAVIICLSIAVMLDASRSVREYTCTFFYISPATGYVTTERELQDDSPFITVRKDGREFAFQREQLIICQPLPAGDQT